MLFNQTAHYLDDIFTDEEKKDNFSAAHANKNLHAATRLPHFDKKQIVVFTPRALSPIPDSRMV